VCVAVVCVCVCVWLGMGNFLPALSDIFNLAYTFCSVALSFIFIVEVHFIYIYIYVSHKPQCFVVTGFLHICMSCFFSTQLWSACVVYFTLEIHGYFVRLCDGDGQYYSNFNYIVEILVFYICVECNPHFYCYANHFIYKCGIILFVTVMCVSFLSLFFPAVHSGRNTQQLLSFLVHVVLQTLGRETCQVSKESIAVCS
jgi:hypothetical protein